MSSKTSIETFFYIGHEKLSLYVFDGTDKKIFVKEILINNFDKKKNLNNSIDEFLRDNIIKIEKKINKKVILIPETKIKTDQTNRTSRVCPISGCMTKNKTTINVIKREKKYLR